jgi:SAM-dependent methyltransferase
MPDVWGTTSGRWEPHTVAASAGPTGACRSCSSPLEHSVVDLGVQPVANSFLTAAQLQEDEPAFPLHAFVCETCWLMQLGWTVSPEEIFSDYAYFSSYSSSWLGHARAYAGMISARLDLGPDDLIVEVASNDGYLLRNFAEQGLRVLGIEPAKNVAGAAIALGVPTETVFLSARTAPDLVRRFGQARLLIGNNVLAHVPDLEGFVSGLHALLAPGGTLTMEFPHLLRLVDEVQFDTIYHEHYSYFSLLAARDVFRRRDLSVVDVEELPTHGGSLRVYVQRSADGATASPRVEELLGRERAAGLHGLETFDRFGAKVERTRRLFLDFLEQARGDGRTVVGYGAPAKGNTLLNACGVSPESMEYTVDLSPHKHGRFLPGSHLPIHPPDKIFETRPDFVVILPWNLKDEISAQMSGIRDWGGRFVVPIPEATVLD